MLINDYLSVLAIFFYIFFIITIANTGTRNKLTFAFCVASFLYGLLNIFCVLDVAFIIDSYHVHFYYSLTYRVIAPFLAFTFFTIAKEISIKKNYKSIIFSPYVTVVLFITAVLLSLPNLYLRLHFIFDDGHDFVQILNDIYGSYRFYIDGAFYFLILSSCIIIFFNLAYNAKTRADKESASILMYAYFISGILLIFCDFILPKLTYVTIPSYSCKIGLIPLSALLYVFKKYNYLLVFKHDYISQTLDTIPIAIGILEDSKVLYLNKAFISFFNFDDKKTLTYKDVYQLFPKQLIESEVDEDKIFELKLDDRIYISKKNFLKNGLVMVSLYDVTFIVNDQKKLAAINEYLNKIFEESTNKLNEINCLIEKQVKKRVASEQEMLKISTKDYLTGLYSKEYFLQQCYEILKTSYKYITKHIVISIDLDDFKNINDTLGYNLGDQLLNEIAIRLKKIVPQDSIISRFGGDEFVIFVKNYYTNQDDMIDALGIRFIKIFKDPYQINGRAISISASIGFSSYPSGGTDIDALVKHASAAMYKAKAQGKSQYAKYEPKHDISGVKIDFTLAKDLHQAIENNELVMYYQPVVHFSDSQHCKTYGYDSLLRWKHPKRGLLSSQNFIALAEKTDFINNLTHWTIDSILRQLHDLEKVNGHSLAISLTMCFDKFDTQKIISMICEKIQAYNLDPQKIYIDIPETYMVKPLEVLKKDFDSLKRLGVNIAIDDFGTQYSSLNYLKYLPVDVIKIDKSFINGIGVNKKDEVIISSLAEFSKLSGIVLIAKSVETKIQCDFLLKNGIKNMQGSYFSKPLNIDDVIKLECLQ
ncbi:MAG: bifunctional diguanylate cyclase/phosphodiesterase [Peptostreptococcaceae bacterium]|nr:bifunctional diguanylate cyclase/phosphodiesterase [uncultured Criibacterium sp.]MBS6063285.1 bifunctional diguanylate cyclase/phosphodiesterase [Peptostreptococcaceae bacterium]